MLSEQQFGSVIGLRPSHQWEPDPSAPTWHFKVGGPKVGVQRLFPVSEVPARRPSPEPTLKGDKRQTPGQQRFRFWQ